MTNPQIPEKTFNYVQFKKERIETAKTVLRGQAMQPADLLDLAEQLKGVKSFSFARRILELAASDKSLGKKRKLDLKIHQQWALCTYKDSDLPVDSRLDSALEILTYKEDLLTTKNQETLGLVGAVYKRKWEFDRQKAQLERSLNYYRRAYQEGVESDQGYTGINAAFVLDLLAHNEEEEAKQANSDCSTASQRRDEAREIRENILELVEPQEVKYTGKWWFYSTIAEAHFGLGQYDEAVEWLKKGQRAIEAKGGQLPDWEKETTINQLASIAIMQSTPVEAGSELVGAPAWTALSNFFDGNVDAVRRAYVGKIGLAMSGGGFRASLFHIGTLAKLAELDVLRHIEVFSCVSGGSVIGAHYYLEVRNLLQTKTDKEISKQDYIDIVKKIESDFLLGVQKNLRMRVAAELTTNLRMLFTKRYSRTMRVGELYEEEIFSKVKDGGEKQERYINELNIYPKGDNEDFQPKLYNWRRAAKAPILILNAATLNTGHNWQFTTSWMGEPPMSIDTDIDTNDVLRRMYYWEAPKEYQQMRLGHAVGASTCVPGLFEPLSLDNLYPDRVVQLVDGGVCDNQGVYGLLEQDCQVILVSDGSGQSESVKMPSNGPVGVLSRSMSIFQSRIRDAQYNDLIGRRRSMLLRGLMFIHLKKDLDPDPIDWIGTLDPFESTGDARTSERKGILTRYGIAKNIQRKLAGIRTDLDSFTDIEAYSLMASAYRMTEDAFNNQACVEGFPDSGENVDWKFLEIEREMKGTGPKYEYLSRLLDVSGNLAFKVWMLLPALKVTGIGLGIVGVLLVSFLFYYFSDTVLVDNLTIGDVGIWIGGLVLFAVLSTFVVGKLISVVKWRDAVLRILMTAGMALIGWGVARIHLHIFDKLFLKLGSIETFRSK